MFYLYTQFICSFFSFQTKHFTYMNSYQKLKAENKKLAEHIRILTGEDFILKSELEVYYHIIRDREKVILSGKRKNK